MSTTTGRRAVSAAVMTLFLAALPGCAEDVESPALDALPLWTATPGIRVGATDDPDLSFDAVTDLKLGPDGRLYSLHMGEPSIRRWTTDGEPTGRLGRSGSGPGEFERPSTMAWKADTLWVFEQSGSRMTFFDTAGVSLGQVGVRVDASVPTQNSGTAPPLRPMGYLADGSILSVTLGLSSEIVEGRLREIAYARSAPDGTTLDTFAVTPIGTETVLGVMMDIGGSRYSGTYTTQPYADGVIGVPAADWGGLLILERKVASVPDAAEFRLSRISLEGDTAFSRSYSYLPTAIDRAETESLIASMAESLHGFIGARNGTTLGQWNAWIDEAMYKPDYHPAIKDMVPLGDGTIWLSRNPIEDGQREWLVLSGEGDPLGRVRLPSGFRLMEAENGRVWGVEMDELDVEYIVSYEIQRE